MEREEILIEKDEWQIPKLQIDRKKYPYLYYHFQESEQLLNKMLQKIDFNLIDEAWFIFQERTFYLLGEYREKQTDIYEAIMRTYYEYNRLYLLLKRDYEKNDGPLIHKSKTLPTALTLDFSPNQTHKMEDAFQVVREQENYLLKIYILDVVRAMYRHTQHFKGKDVGAITSELYLHFLEQQYTYEESFKQFHDYSAICYTFKFKKNYKLQNELPEISESIVHIERNLFEEELTDPNRISSETMSDTHRTLCLARELLKNLPTTQKYCARGKLSHQLALFLNTTIATELYRNQIPYIEKGDGTGEPPHYGSFTTPLNDFPCYINQYILKKYLYSTNFQFHHFNKDRKLVAYMNEQQAAFQKRKKEIK